MASPSSFPRTIPYNKLPLLPPKIEIETKRTLKLAINARAALSDLKGEGRLIPNQAVLVRAIVLQEAKLSSEVENIVTTNDDLYRALSKDSQEGNPHTKEVLRYGEAVWSGVRHLQENHRMNPDLFAALASIINDVDTGVRKQSGTRIGNQATGQIIYSPPVGEDLIRGLLTNLCEFIYDDQDDIDPLVKLAVAHYQFEAIHPFPDGNGRTGRVLNILFLIERRLLEIPVLYLSRYIIQNKSRYYHGLREVTEHGAWEDWISLILQAIEATAIETRKRIHSIRQAMTEAKELIKVAAPKMYSHELVELIFSQPYTRIGFLEQSGLAKRQTASVYLKRLEELGILVSVKSWRETLYLNPKLMQLLAA